MKIVQDDIYTRLNEISFEAYYQGLSNFGELLHWRALKLFRQCPAYFRALEKGIEEMPEKPSSAVATIGMAFHKLVLEGDAAFNEAYCVSNGPLNPKTGAPYGRASKAYAEWAEKLEKTVLSVEEFAQLEQMAEALRAHTAAQELLSEGHGGVIKAWLADIPAIAKLDHLHPRYGIVDLKTCDDLSHFERDVRHYDYIYALAYQRLMLKAAGDVEAECSLIAVEKKYPFRVGVWVITHEVLRETEHQILSLCQDLNDAYLTDEWVTHFEKIRIIDSL